MIAGVVAVNQPAKLAAFEALFKTQTQAPLTIGGIPNSKSETNSLDIEIPGLLSFMVNRDFHSTVKGLDSIAPENQPPVAITHYSFQIMVGLGMIMMFISVIYLTGAILKKKWRNSQWMFRLFVYTIPAGFIAVEAGWTLTEVGRQPWILQGIMRTSEAVTPMPGIIYSFYLFTAVYFSLALLVIFLLYRQIKMVGKLYDIPENIHFKMN